MLYTESLLCFRHAHMLSRQVIKGDIVASVASKMKMWIMFSLVYEDLGLFSEILTMPSNKTNRVVQEF